MVKKWIIMLIIIVVLAVGCIFESNYVNRAFLDLEESLQKYKTTIEQSEENSLNTDKNIQTIQSLHNGWHEKVRGLKCFIWHSGVKDVEVGLSRIKTYTSENDKTETLAELNSLIDYLWHYSEDFTITIENIL